VDVPENGLTKTEPGGALVLDGDVTANFPAGQNVDLQNINNASCGDAVVQSSAYNAETGKTTVTLDTCALDEGKTVADITGAKPVAAITSTAIKSVKSFAAKKSGKAVVKKEVATKANTVSRG
jgi:hypothetical protein